MLTPDDYLPLVRQALAEDLGANGDISSTAVFPPEEMSECTLYAKDAGVLCGIDIFKAVFLAVNPAADVHLSASDGDRIEKGQPLATVRGSTCSILTVERTALNFLSHLSAIATKASKLVEAAAASAKEAEARLGRPVRPITILDTRKTIPGLRVLQKYAVKTGGADNHRMGLHDMVMLKDNHIDAAGGITAAVKKVRAVWGARFKIEVETRSLDEVREALSLAVDRIMLDNMDNETMAKAASIIGGACEIEASGNMTVERLKSLAGLGITHISFGELTHSVNVFDFSLRDAKRLQS